MHPMVVMFPVALLTTAVIFDLIHLVAGEPVLSQVAYWNILVGLVMGLVAAVPGLVDFLAIPGGTRARRVGLMHGLGNLCVLVLFFVVWLTRLRSPDHEVSVGGFVIEVVGITLATATAWLGGELMDRLGVGVDPDAHLDAPNSLSGAPAGASRERLPDRE
jgi:uncharacterized membrane protein